MKDKKILETEVSWEGFTKQRIHPALGVFKNDGTEHLYFGVSLPSKIKFIDGDDIIEDEEEKYYMVGDNGKLYDPVKLENEILFKVNPNIFNRWNKDNIHSFIDNKRNDKPTIDVYEIFNELKEVLKTHIGLNKEEEYDILTLWIIGTYVHTCFNSYPYLFFYGAKGCGKSNALKVLSYFSFNGMFLARPSASNVFRLVNTLQCTLAIDELDLSNLKKDDDAKDLHSILLNGYKRDACVPRSSENDLDNIRMYPIYSPKALAGSKILADMIKDRSIEFIMIKSDTSYPTFIDNNFSAELRDKLYILALEIWKDVMREYANLESNTSIQGREKEKWQGLLALGNAFQMDYKNLQEFALFKINEHLEEEMIDSEERNILRVLNGLVIGDQWYYAKDLKDGYIEYLRSIDENVDYVRERYVVKLIKKIGLISEKGLTHGKARLLIKRSALNSIMKSYGFKDSDINLG
jgi:hypothetical protein